MRAVFWNHRMTAVVATAALIMLTMMVATHLFHHDHINIDQRRRAGLIVAATIDIPTSKVNHVVRRHFPSYSLGEHKRLSGGVINAVFRCELLSGSDRTKDMIVVIKFSNPSWKNGCKLRNEISAMRLVRRHTDIPIPRILAASDESQNNGVGFDYVVLSFESGQRANEVMETLTQSQRRSVFVQWSQMSVELRKIPFQGFGSLTSDIGTFTAQHDDGAESDAAVTLAALAGNGLCSGLGPFASYAEYAAAKVEQFIPLLPHHSTYLIPRLQDWLAAVLVQDVAIDVPSVLIHHDVSIRNLLISIEKHTEGIGADADAYDGGVKLSCVFDWEFALAAPFDEEACFGFMLDGLSKSDVDMFWEEWRRAGLPHPRRNDLNSHSQTVFNNSLMYENMIKVVHAHMWDLTPMKLADTISTAQATIEQLLRSRNC
eukprot:m.88742 g.88742  ORF g.88742 m.88742 type:complete len:430 (-) comp26231_c0_seq1:42-1331(-)